jgi:hypothetical protein
VRATVWNDVMAEVQALPTNDLSGVIPARSSPFCMDAYDSHRRGRDIPLL